ncbi:hypothetical protein C2845_PM04G25840 [Panicum miliaceum]|uniref:Uncharacterized protein n=1 Tax=Panicum miliaceum TaxID=4540 RepID=A0A3L6QR02_PANMI|nr:hypothetical protein C2845_PM04G25840 [Panicum miliaceum]
MAAMARNAVVLLVLLGVVVQLCSVVPPVAAAGRVLQDVVQKSLVQGGLGGDAKPDTCVTGGGNVGPSGQTVASGSVYCQREKVIDQQASLTVAGQTVNTAPLP